MRNTAYEGNGMFNAKISIRNVALAGTVTFLVGAPAFAQNPESPLPRKQRQSANRGFANRVVEGLGVGALLLLP